MIFYTNYINYKLSYKLLFRPEYNLKQRQTHNLTALFTVHILILVYVELDI